MNITLLFLVHNQMLAACRQAYQVEAQESLSYIVGSFFFFFRYSTDGKKINL